MSLLNPFDGNPTFNTEAILDPWSGESSGLPTTDEIFYGLENTPAEMEADIFESWGWEETYVSPDGELAGGGSAKTASAGGGSMGEMGLFGGMMAVGMISQGAAAWLNGESRESADKRWAQAMESIATTNATARTEIAETNANMMITTTGMQVMAMMYQANLQYQQAQERMVYMDMADQRQHSLWKQQLSNDIRSMTLALNAQIHADNLQYSQLMTAERNRHDEVLEQMRIEALEAGVDEAELTVDDAQLFHA